MGEDHAAEWPDQEAYREGRVGRQDAGERIEIREEQTVQHERGGGAVEIEVIPLDNRADRAGADYLPSRRTRHSHAGLLPAPSYSRLKCRFCPLRVSGLPT